MKAIIQIPCYNEEETLGITLSQLPREIPGIDVVEWLLIDDGSTDRSVDIAEKHGVDHIVRLKHNSGLAKAFRIGLDACLNEGADIIINTDADNQYCADDIPKLVEPILKKEAEIVVGQRPIDQTEHFSKTKKVLQKLGSWVVRKASGSEVADAPSGFRAFSREAAMRLNVFSEYTYTLETIIQAGQKRIPIKSVPIRTNEDLRPSRLVRSIFSYLTRSASTIIRIFSVYRPLRFFAIAGTVPAFFGFLLCLRYLILLIEGTTRSHAPSLILAAILIIIGVQLLMFGFIADLIATNRRILEELQYEVRKEKSTKREKRKDHYTD
jgi:glycosyltransferase involved in cell wall biosynthesis